MAPHKICKLSASARAASAGFAVLSVLIAMLAARGAGRAESLGGPSVDAPNEHFAIADAARLEPEAAQRAYHSLAELMMRGYASSAEPAARRYIAWRRFNSAPYPSATHGNRYVNNYANAEAAAAGYGRPAQVMPPGAIVAKDSFTATEKGRLWPGALFVMEKLKAGADPATADWRYLMIMPDGSTFGDSRVDPAKMAFCHACHAARADDDYLFFVPADVAALPAGSP